jgi:hypothetical protein
MPLDAAIAAEALPVDAVSFHGVPRHVLARHAMAALDPASRRAVIAIEIEDAGRFVNMGMNFDRVRWRAVWRLPGLPEAGGIIALRKGEIVC